MARRRWKALSASALLFFMLQTNVLGQGKPSLIGTWQAPGPAGPIRLIFESKSRLTFDGEPAKYTLAPGVIRIDDGEEVVDYPYILSGNVLTISFPEGMRLQFSRTNPGSAPPANTGKTAPPGAGPGSLNNSELAAEISGIWWGYSGSTERKIGLCPQGRYHDYTESSYSGSSKDSLGNPSTAWGTANQKGSVGTWSIQGNYQEGIISVRQPDGNESSIRYKQCGEPGCLFFNGHKLCRTGRCN